MAMQVKIPPHTEIIQREISRVFLGTTFAYFICGAVFDSTDKSLLHTQPVSGSPWSLPLSHMRNLPEKEVIFLCNFIFQFDF